jgi:parallel beta-helix repeat protein
MRTSQFGIVVLLVTASFAGMINLTGENVQGTLVGGTISTDTRWQQANSPYVIVSPINIVYGGNLRIEAGVQVQYDGDHPIYVDGVLTLDGTSMERVTIESNPPFMEYMDWTGIQVGPKGYVDIKYADLSFSGQAITLKSSYNKIVNTSISNNKLVHSIMLDASIENTISGNALTGLGLGISGNALEHFNSHTIPPGNTVNGKPLHYYKDSYNISVNADPVGQLIFANCTNSFARDLQITGSGILAAYTTNTLIYNNNITQNSYGVRLYESSQIAIVSNNMASSYFIGLYLTSSDWNIIINNNIASSFMGIAMLGSTANGLKHNDIQSNYYGIQLYESEWNSIYANNFVDNFMSQAFDGNSNNMWTDLLPDGGNYWSDYSPTCQDLYSGVVTPQTTGVPDGICDNPYYIDGDSIDYYPRVNPAALLPTSIPGNTAEVPPDTQSPAVEPAPPTASAEERSIELKGGWNTVSYPLDTEMTVSEALSGLPYERVELKEEGSEMTVLLTDSDVMRPGSSYLIKVSSAAIWIFDD